MRKRILRRAAMLWIGACGIAMAQSGSYSAITEYKVPTINSHPFGITVGPDGALWFTEEFTNQIGRVTTAGAFSEYLIPTADAEPDQIAAGPDGALWFTESLGNQIGRITTAGEFSEFPIPTPSSYPAGIVAGPDGALWFTETNPIGKIGRITTAGDITEYVVPTSGFSSRTGLPQDRTGRSGLPTGALMPLDESPLAERSQNTLSRLLRRNRSASSPDPMEPCGSPKRPCGRSGGSRPRAH